MAGPGVTSGLVGVGGQAGEGEVSGPMGCSEISGLTWDGGGGAEEASEEKNICLLLPDSLRQNNQNILSIDCVMGMA